MLKFFHRNAAVQVVKKFFEYCKICSGKFSCDVQGNQAAFAFHKSVDVKKIVVKQEIVVDNKIRQIFLFVDAVKKARVGIKKFCGMSF